MTDRVTYKINECDSKIELLVEVAPRFVAKEDVTTVSTESVLKILLDKNLKYDTMLSCPAVNLCNKNKGSLTHGKWVFSKKKEQSEATKPKPRRSRKTTKTKD